MIISKEVDYALRILRRLQDGQLCAVPKIAKDTLVPKLYAYKILKRMEKAGLVASVQGPLGGYRLVADLREHNLHDLIVGFGGRRLVTVCMNSDWSCEWLGQNGHCVTQKHLVALQGELDELLKSYTLDRLIGIR